MINMFSYRFKLNMSINLGVMSVAERSRLGNNDLEITTNSLGDGIKGFRHKRTWSICEAPVAFF
jgi:hypothetical protein